MKIFYTHKAIIVLIILFCSLGADAANFYWIGGGAGTWNTVGRWSNTSGGASNGAIPGGADDVFFDAGGLGPCTLNVNAVVNSITMSGGTLIQGAFSISTSRTTIGFAQSGGTFTGGSGVITINGGGDFNLSAGSFTSTSDTLLLRGDFSMTGGTFTHNSGTVKYWPVALTATVTGSHSLYNLVLLDNTSSAAATLDFGGATLTVNNNLITRGTGTGALLVLNNGDIHVKKDVYIYNQWNGLSSAVTQGTAVVTFNGAGTQNFVGWSFGSGALSNVTVTKAAGDVLNIVDTPTVGRNYTYNSGIVNCIGTFGIQSPTNIATTVTGSHSLSKVLISAYIVDFSGSTITIDSLLTLAPSSTTINNGTIILNNDLYTQCNDVIGGGTLNIMVQGPGTQIFTGNSTAGGGSLPNVIITKNPADSLIITGPRHLCAAENWTYNSGIIGGTGIVCFSNSNAVASQTITGSHSLPNVVFWVASGGTGNKIIASGTVLTVPGQLYWAPLFGGNININTGEVHAKSDITITNSAMSGGGTGTLVINGTGAQLLLGANGGVVGGGRLPNVRVDKASGTLSIDDVVSVAGDWTFLRGTVDASTLASTVCFATPGKTIDLVGTGSMKFYNTILADVNTRALLSDISVQNQLELRQGKLALNTFDLTVENAATTAISNILTPQIGFIVSETDGTAGYGKVKWNIGNAAAGAVYNIPFGDSTVFNAIIPFTYTVQTAGTQSGSGQISVATYSTDWTLNPNNRPLPTGVTNLNNVIGIENATKELDRYWIVEQNNYSTRPVGQLGFRYYNDEWSIFPNNIAEYKLKPHKWNGSAWSLPLTPATIDTLNNLATLGSTNTNEIYTLFDPDLPDLEIRSSDTVICAGNTIQFFDAQVIPSPQSYFWRFPGGSPTTSASASPTVTYSTVGTYTVILEGTYAGGNVLIDTFPNFITVVAAPVASISAQTNITCNGLCNGTATASATGGGPYTYRWSASAANQTTATATALCAGTHSVIVTSTPSGCTDTVTVTITQPAALTASIGSQTNVNCNGTCNGSATITAGGGSGTYTYTWPASAANQTTATGSNLCAGTYTVTVKDAAALTCSTTVSVTITAPPVLTATISGQTNLTCNGVCIGTATVTAGGGAGTYTYAWPASAANQTTATATNLCAGTYVVTVADGAALTCTKTASVTITQPTALVAGVGSQTNLTCGNVCNGSATLTRSGGSGTYTYAWPASAANQTTQTATNLCAGTYVVTVADAATPSCSTTVSVTITAPPAVTATITAQTNVNCNGVCNGSATVAGGGGGGTYTYTWPASAGGATTATATNLCAGTYAVTVKDAAALTCSTTVSVTITQPPALTATVGSQTNLTCNAVCTGTATITPGGGAGTYTYTWPVTAGSQTTQTATSLCAGTYVVTVKDGAALTCSTTVSVTITQPAALTATISSQTNLLCNGVCTGAATVTPGGGSGTYTYTWPVSASSQTTATATNLCAGTYVVTVADAAAPSCTVTASVTITQPAALAASIPTQTNLTCGNTCNGSATVTRSGGSGAYTYAWPVSAGSQITQTATNLCAGTYVVTVADAAASTCSVTASVTITAPPAVTATISAQTNVNCNGVCNGSATITPGGGGGTYTYAWPVSAASQTTATATNLCAGTYVVTVADGAAPSCSTTVSVTITQPPALTATISAQTNLTCNAVCIGTATVTPGGGAGTYTYAWPVSAGSQTTATATNLCAGTYIVTVADGAAAGCTVTASVTITQPPALTATISSQTNLLCNGVCTGAATVTPGGGAGTYTYAWPVSANSQTTATASNLCAGTYVVTVADAAAPGCTVTASVTITQPAVLTATISAQTNLTCGNTCNGTATVTPGGGSGAYTYAWPVSAASQTTATATSLCAGTYIVTVADAAASTCSVTASVTITAPPAVTATISSQTNVNCNGVCNGSATITGGGGGGTYTYAWPVSAGSQTTATASNLCAGTYVVTVADGAAPTCSTTVSVTITQPPALTATISAQTNLTCNGVCTGTATVTPGGGAGTYTYAWPASAGSQTTATATNLCAGTYVVTVADGAAPSCTVTASVTITQPPALTATISAQTNLSCFGVCNGSATVTPGGGAGTYTYLWPVSAAGQTTATANNLCAGTYVVTVADAAAPTCSTTASVTITEPTQLTANITDSSHVSCFGLCDGDATVTAAGGTPGTGYTYSWTNNPGTGATIASLCANTYIVTVQDANGCTAKDTVVITQPTVLTARIIDSTMVSCFNVCDGGAVILGAGGTPPYNYLWSNPAATANDTVTGLCDSTYVGTITDANGCIARDTVIITEPAVLAITSTSTNLLCNGVCIGAIDITVTGGTPNYTYLWSNGATTEDLNGLCAGTYTVTVTDAHGCTAILSVTITQPPVLVANITSSTNLSCNAICDGDAVVVAGGGSPGYTYLWNTIPASAFNQANDTASLLCAGTYQAIVTDTNGCIARDTVLITAPPLLVATIDSFRNLSCNGVCDGFARAIGSGGLGGYTYLWSNAQTTAAISNLCAGTYIVTVTDGNGCEAYDTVTITEPPLLTATVIDSVNLLCNSVCTGRTVVLAGGGTPGYTYLWNNTPVGTANDTATNLCAGTYIVTVTDANGCTASDTVTLTQPPLLTVDITGVVQVLCNGACTGSATATPAGGTPNYNYLWSNGATTQTINSLCAGTYIVTVTDANGCTASDTVIITQPPVLTADITSSLNVSCFGLCDGEATVVGGGGTPGTGYTYAWSPTGGTGATGTAMCAGFYTVSVIDANSCTATDTITITQPPVLTATIVSSENASCFGVCDGQAVVVAAGGTPFYDYRWNSSPSQVNDTASALCAGTYIALVTDFRGCTASDTVIITEPPVLSIDSITVVNLLCNGVCTGTATPHVSGGTAPYTYIWSNGFNTPGLTGLCAGTYILTVTDANGCNTSDTIVVTEPPVLTATITSSTNLTCNSVCDGGAVVLAGGGTPGYTYLWSNTPPTANDTVTGLCAGNFIVTVTDANLCTDTAHVLITQPPLLTATIDTIRNVSCFDVCDGFAGVTANGGVGNYTYLWSTGATTDTVGGLCDGVYFVTVTDANGCTAADTVTITEPTLLVATIIASTNPLCNGLCTGTADLTVTGGTLQYTYLWSNGGTTEDASALCAGTYIVTVTDANGCTDTATVTITEPPVLVIDSIVTTNLLCFNQCIGTATPFVTGGTPAYSYAWNNGAASGPLTGLCAGTYILTVTDGNGCTATDTITITEPLLLTAVIIDTVNLSCNNVCDGSTVVLADGGTPGYTYLWNGDPALDNDTISSLCAGQYIAVVTDTNGCTASDTVVITEPPVLTATISSSTNASCFDICDGDATVTPAGGTPPYTYAWNNGQTSATDTALCDGIYIITVTDANGCTASDTVTITEPPVLVADITFTSNLSCNAICDGEGIVVASGGTPGYTYAWQTAGGPVVIGDTATGLCAGFYIVTVTDDNGCVAGDTVTITEPPVLTAVITDSTNLSCNASCDGGAVVTAGGGTPGYTYLWSNGQTTDTLANVCAGTYIVTVTDANGCTKSDTVTITEPTVLVASIDSVRNISCNGVCDGIAIVTPSGGTPGYLFAWSGGQTIDTATALCAGFYTVTVTDANGCTATDTVTVTEPPVLAATITDTNMVSCNGVCDADATVTPTGGTAPYTYLWDDPNAQTTATADSLCAGTYSVTITDDHLCTTTATVTITEPTVLTADIDTFTNLTCNASCDGTAGVTGGGGTPPYTYLWSSGGQVGTVAINLCAGTHRVTITDANGCRAIDSILISEPPVLTATITASTNASCNGVCDGTATAAASGGTPGYTYLWTPGGQTTTTATALCAGTYVVAITDTNGCIARDTVIITQPQPIAITMGSRNITCNGFDDGRAWAGVTGGTQPYTYTWDAGVPVSAGDTVVALAPGVVTVIVTDLNGCADTASVTITEPTPLTVTLTQTNVNCFNGSDGTADAAPAGGTAPYIYTWSGGTPVGQGAQVVNLTAGQYCVTITDANGCTVSDCVTITQPAAPLSVTIAGTNVTCHGACDGTATVTPAGGTAPYIYIWNDPAQQTTATASNLCVGTYSVTVTDANGCSVFANIAITEPAELLLTIVVDSNSNCYGGATGGLTVSLTGGTAPYDYNWTAPAISTTGSNLTTNSVANIPAQSYTVTVVDANGCTKVISANVGERPGPAFGGVDVTPTICNEPNGSICVQFTTGDPPLNYVWSNGAPNASCASGLADGTYILTVSDASQCDTVLTIVVDAIDKPHVDSTFQKESYCGNDNGIIEVFFSGGVEPYSFNWSHDTLVSGPVAEDLPPGTYTVTVSDVNGCDSTLSFTITDTPAPDIELVTMSPDTIHLGQSVDIEIELVSGDSIAYLWEPNQWLSCTDCLTATATPEETITYFITSTDVVTGCMDTIYYTIIVKDENNIFVPNAITPNGDGINDVWMIRDLEQFPDNEIIVLNRWGDEVFRAAPYLNDWDGTYNGKPLPAATYYYVIKLNDIAEGVTGSITIIK